MKLLWIALLILGGCSAQSVREPVEEAEPTAPPVEATTEVTRVSKLELFKGNVAQYQCNLIGDEDLNNSEIGQRLGTIQTGISREKLEGILGSPTATIDNTRLKWINESGENQISIHANLKKDGNLKSIMFYWTQTTSEGISDCSWALRDTN